MRFIANLGIQRDQSRNGETANPRTGSAEERETFAAICLRTEPPTETKDDTEKKHCTRELVPAGCRPPSMNKQATEWEYMAVCLPTGTYSSVTRTSDCASLLSNKATKQNPVRQKN